MTRPQTIFLFRYGNSALYALTKDESGAALPTRMFPGGWSLEKSIVLNPNKPSSKRELIRVTLQTIDKHGFYLTHAALAEAPLAQFV